MGVDYIMTIFLFLISGVIVTNYLNVWLQVIFNLPDIDHHKVLCT